MVSMFEVCIIWKMIQSERWEGRSNAWFRAEVNIRIWQSLQRIFSCRRRSDSLYSCLLSTVWQRASGQLRSPASSLFNLKRSWQTLSSWWNYSAGVLHWDSAAANKLFGLWTCRWMKCSQCFSLQASWDRTLCEGASSFLCGLDQPSHPLKLNDQFSLEVRQHDNNIHW